MSASARRNSASAAPASPAVHGAAHADHPLILGRHVIREEAAVLAGLATRLDDRFSQAVSLIAACRGSVIVSGMGKAGLIGQKIAATLASTGTRSHFLHPAEAVHGDLGRIGPEDLVLLLSHSGETEEILRLVPCLIELDVPRVAITGRERSSLARQATVVICIGEIREAGRLELAPSCSTTAMLAVGDALALTVSAQRGFTAADFARLHPAGALGRRLARVDELMRPLEACRVAPDGLTVRQVLVTRGRPGRRCGAVLLVDDGGVLTGIFTDSDLARLLERQQDHLLDQPIRNVMSNSPTTVCAGTMMTEAVEILSAHKISELPVIDERQRPVGLIDITDVVAWMPAELPGSDGAPAVCVSEKLQDRPETERPDEGPMILPWMNPGGPRRVDET